MPRHQQLSEEEFAGWLSHPVTQAMKAFLRAGIEQAKLDFVDGTLVMTDQWQSAMKQANVIGRCEMAQRIIDLELSQLGTDDEE